MSVLFELKVGRELWMDDWALLQYLNHHHHWGCDFVVCEITMLRKAPSVRVFYARFCSLVFDDSLFYFIFSSVGTVCEHSRNAPCCFRVRCEVGSEERAVRTLNFVVSRKRLMFLWVGEER